MADELYYRITHADLDAIDQAMRYLTEDVQHPLGLSEERRKEARSVLGGMLLIRFERLDGEVKPLPSRRGPSPDGSAA